MPGAMGGAITASILLKKFKLSCEDCLRWMFILSMLTLAFSATFLIQCDNADFVGVNYGNGSISGQANQGNYGNWCISGQTNQGN